MKLSLEGLKAAKQWQEAGVALPSYDVEAVSAATKEAPIWVHFGIGNIFRIFIGGIADKLIATGESGKGITCVETIDFDVVDKIYDPYDNLVLGVTLKADGSTEKQVIGSLTEAIKAQTGDQETWKRLRAIFTDPGLQMCSFTITEKGYALRNANGDLFPFVAADIEAGPSDEVGKSYNSAMSIVAALLYERFKAGKYPMAVVSMDNCSHNGEKLMSSIVGVAELWQEKGFVPAEFVAYLKDESCVSFPWSMIDKITPRPAESVQAELEKLGIEDMAPVITSKRTYIAPFVNAEGPQYLVIEDKFPNGRPALEKAGVYMTDRDTVNKVERMKVTTCLNPLHTALAVYGCVLGYTLIADEMKDKELKELVERIGLVEGMPVVTDPGILSPKDFVDEVIKVRIPNPFMPDTPQRIATDTSQKVGIRYGETIKSYVAEYGDAKKLEAIPLALAGWLRYLLGVDDEGNAFERSTDPMLDTLTEALKDVKLGDGTEKIHDSLCPILSNANIFGMNLYEAGLGEKIEALFAEEIAGPGAVRATLKKYLD
ncbi:MAG: mannitol dehydrogenase family protein [Blautia sp.]|nr:mannitol dehydrogenase family protein [Blautia sp.]